MILSEFNKNKTFLGFEKCSMMGSGKGLIKVDGRLQNIVKMLFVHVDSI